MAEAAAIGEDIGAWSRFQTLLPWKRNGAAAPEDDQEEEGGGKKSGPKWWRVSLATLLCIIILAVATLVRAFDPVLISALRVKTFDLYQRMSPRPATQYPVGIIDIDEKSLSEIGQWPWPRSTIAKMLDQSAKFGAAVVGFDIVFAEPDRMSPALVADRIDFLDPTTKSALKGMRSNEAVMAEVMRRTRVVVGQVGRPIDLPAGKVAPSTRTPVMAFIGPHPKTWLLQYKTRLGNVPQLEKAAKGHGLFSVADEYDGVVRRVPMVYSIGKKVYPSLSLEMLRVAFGARTIATKTNQAGLVSVVLQGRQKFEIPTDNHGRIWVHFAKPDKFDSEENEGRLYISASDIIQGKVSKGKLKGKLLVVGTSAVGLKDIRNTPIYGRLPGVEIHANILENIFAAQGAYNKVIAATQKATIEAIPVEVRKKVGAAEAKLNGVKRKIIALQRAKKKPTPALITEYRAAAAEHKNIAGPVQAQIKAAVSAQKSETPFRSFFLRYPNIMNSVEIALTILSGIAMMVLIPRLGPLLTLVGVVAAGGVMAAVTWYLYIEYQMLIDVTYPGAVTIAVYSVLTFANYAREAAEKRQVRGAFGQYLSPALVEQLAENPDQLTLGGETKEMTFLFCDVRGFTTISEQFKANPQGLTVLINRLLTPLTGEILEREGTIDKYMGDCIMAFWNAPLDDKDHSLHACESSLAMFESLIELNAEREKEAEEEGTEFLPLNVGIGINTGDCVVGNMGSEQRFDYSVLGDAVNLAARLEGQSKNYGVGTVIGEITHDQVGEKFAVIELDQIAVKGKTEAVTIFGLLGDGEMRSSPEYLTLLETHNKMLAAYRSQNFEEAGELVKKCRPLAGAPEVLYDLYDERIEQYIEDPPDPDWDGVFVATSK